tara:strand:+ start:1911 stop:2255 length:345 start_codon:yes stop_codon:yes gene_type:complete
MKKYFVFKGTISGWRYFIRTLLQTLLVPFLIGLYLISVTAYKRASALTDKKWLIITAAISSPILSINQILNQAESDAEFMAQNMPPVYWVFIIIFGLIHLWLLFANSKIENHEG